MLDYIQNNWLEWFGVLTGLLYIFLEIRQRTSMWVIGFFSSFVFVIVFFKSKLYADMVLNIYYVTMSVYGFWLWKKNGNEAEPIDRKDEITYQNLGLWLGAILLLISTVLYLGIASVLHHYTDSPVPYSDAFPTALSLIATWLLAKKYLEQWLVWIVVNVFSIGLFTYRGLYPTAFLFLVYGILSVVGYLKWKADYKPIMTNVNE
ncbi:nicotinamide riboside transporter PnuC [Parabacteroides sp. FAFU027]|uniref:nicotinamide riboside transporter PnuC n=1 Tax=Parabacteroides sp. FAFU027 TaxID=2922715 RepID=UPI001FAF2317|nr:nicotinamide riboside transporter PnuC [Parabacteroides sp. FAFU027]